MNFHHINQVWCQIIILPTANKYECLKFKMSYAVQYMIVFTLDHPTYKYIILLNDTWLFSVSLMKDNHGDIHVFSSMF